MQITLQQYLLASVPLRILVDDYKETECQCFHAFVTDETKRGKKPIKRRVKFYTCQLHRTEVPQVEIDLESLPDNFPLSPRNAFRLKQKKAVAERVAKLQAMKEDKEAMAQMDALAADLNQQIANDNNNQQ